jgi:hypothetical protein
MPAIFWLAFAVLWILVLIQGFALLEMIRQLVDIRQGTETLVGPQLLPDTVPIGENLPSAPSLQWAQTGAQVDWSTALGEVATALVLLHPGCATCYTVARGLRVRGGHQRLGVKVFAIVTAYSPERAQEFITETKLPVDATLVEGPSPENGSDPFAKTLNLNRKPAAVTLRGTRIVAAATVLSGKHVEMLLDDVLEGIERVRDGFAKEPVLQTSRSSTSEAKEEVTANVSNT